MRASKFFFSTQKETPADAVVISHQLMLRAGMIRPLASGLYSWLPLGLRVLNKVITIIRQEMDQSGANEILMPIVQNAELWQESGRWNDYGNELLRFHDRHDRDFLLGPTHEEVVTDLIRNDIKSYKQLPLNFYQIQTKFRDEIRPRFGVMRGREFIMKDAYSFHENTSCLDQEYQNMHDTYARIFNRLSLKFRAVEADTGSIGGNVSHEFHVLAESGEDAIAFSDESDYAANIEKAIAVPVLTSRKAPTQEMVCLDTTTKNLSDMPDTEQIKTIIVKASPQMQEDWIALMIRKDHHLSVTKAESLEEVAAPLQYASETTITKMNLPHQFLGPIKLPIPCIVDLTVAKMSNFTAGANQKNKRYDGINWERDTHYLKETDLREVVEGDLSPDGQGKLFIKRGIEVGHIFKLGTKYSQAMNVNILNHSGKKFIPYMGCYGLGVTRIVAAAIEQNNDSKGIIWPISISPFTIVIIALNYEKSEDVRILADSLEKQLLTKNIDVLLDDRKISPGIKMIEMDLIGIPYQLIISQKGIDNQEIEYKNRRLDETQKIHPDKIMPFLSELLY